MFGISLKSATSLIYSLCIASVIFSFPLRRENVGEGVEYAVRISDDFRNFSSPPYRHSESEFPDLGYHQSFLAQLWNQNDTVNGSIAITWETLKSFGIVSYLSSVMGFLGMNPFNATGNSSILIGVPVQSESPYDAVFVCELVGSIAGGLLLFFGLFLVAQRLRRSAQACFITIIHKRRKFEVVQRRSIIPKTALIIQGSLGEGTFGSVDLGVFVFNRKKNFVAVKRTRIGIFGSGKNHLKNEIDVLTRVRSHPNVVGLAGFCCDEVENILLLERCGLGDLRSCLPGRPFGSRIERFHFYTTILLQVAKGMKHLVQSLSLVHRDFCGRNILLDFDGTYNAKIADFGLALVGIRSEVTMKKRERLPWRILPLEAISDLTFSIKTDVWSFGMLVFEIFSGGIIPFSCINNSTDLIGFLASGGMINPPYRSPTEIITLMHGCCQLNAVNRFTWMEIISHLEEFLVQLSAGGTGSDVQTSDSVVVHGSDCGCSHDTLEVIEEEPELDVCIDVASSVSLEVMDEKEGTVA